MIQRLDDKLMDMRGIEHFYGLPIIRSREHNGVLIELRKLPTTRIFFGLINPPAGDPGPAEWYSLDGADIEGWWSLMLLRFS